MLTKTMLEKVLPSNLRGAATQELTDKLNSIGENEFIAEEIRNNFVSYVGILRDGKYKTEDYLHAVAYVSFKLRGDSNQDAYLKTFPQRYQELLRKGATPKDISAYVAAYNKGKLVNAILEQSLVPIHVLNQDLRQKAINQLATLMVYATSEKVQSDSANALLTHLATPKEAVSPLHLHVAENAGINELKGLLVGLAREQITSIQGGASTKEVAAQRIIDVEPEKDE